MILADHLVTRRTTDSTLVLIIVQPSQLITSGKSGAILQSTEEEREGEKEKRMNLKKKTFKINVCTTHNSNTHIWTVLGR